MAETLNLSTSDGPMLAYWAEPKERTGRAVVVIQEAFGMTDHIESICRRLADAGFAAIAPHLFHRVGDPVLSYDDLESAMVPTKTLAKAQVIDDITACNDFLRERGYAPTATGIVGFCIGGTIAFMADTEITFGAAATFYGSGVNEQRQDFGALAEIAPRLRAPWIGFYGDQDGGIPVSDVEDLRTATSKLSVATEIVRYPEAGHGFNCDARSSFEPQSAKDAWERLLDWFDTNLQAS